MARETGSAREEAERLVAAVLAMASQSGRSGADRGRDDRDDSISGTSARLVEGLGTLGDTLAGMVGQLAGAASGRPHRDGDAAVAGDAGAGARRTDATHEPATTGRVRYGLATGSAECCVCPVCRAIANLRDPSPESAARLATGAGDFATGVASLMRAFSAMSGTRSRPAKPRRPVPPPDPDLAWSAATRTAADGGRHDAGDLTPDEDESPWAAATRAADRQAGPPARGTSGAAAGPPEGSGGGSESPASTPGPRTSDGVDSPAESAGDARPGPVSHAAPPGDVWAAATAGPVDGADGGAALPSVVSHDDPADGTRSGTV